MDSRLVIVGAGQAAAQLIDTLRRKGYSGAITLLGDEPYLPYQRPPLSKKYLAGALELDRLLLKQRLFYDEHRIALHLGRRAESIDRARREVVDQAGDRHAYDKLVLATGSRARRISLPGAELAGVLYLKTLADADAIRAEALAGRRAVIVGGGYIGLEAAATLRGLGLEVTVLEMADRVMNRVVCAPVSQFYQSEHARHGVRLVLNARPTEFLAAASGRIGGVRCADGTEHAADLVVVGIGVLPEDGLAQRAGLDCSNGIVIDSFCRTSDPAVYAIGDCSNFASAHYGVRLRLESVDNAFEQANTAALDIVGSPVAHDKVPWFWSDQYEHKMLIVGISQGHDQLVVRGDARGPAFSACYLRGGELIAIDTINNAKDQMAARKLIAARARPDPLKLADPAIPLKDC